MRDLTDKELNKVFRLIGWVFQVNVGSVTLRYDVHRQRGLSDLPRPQQYNSGLVS